MARRLPCAALLAVAGLVLPLHDSAAARQTPGAADFREIVRSAKSRVFPAVVYVRVVRDATEQGRKGAQQASGSGVIVTPRGEVLTNWHVVEKAQSVRCLLSDGRAMTAAIVGSDKDTDLALLRLDLPEGAADLPAAPMGDSATLEEGDFVMAMGAPFGLNRSVSIGIISCTRRFLPEVSEYSLWLQTDAAINPGNSGGPLVNTQGEIVGINARGMGFAEGMGFAIPAETVAIVVPQLRAHGATRWSWTGLQLQPLRDFDREIYFDETEGVIVAETDPESPARRAGIASRDRIVAIAGAPITAMTEEDLPAVRRRLATLPMGTPVEIALVRDGAALTVELVPRDKGKVEGDELVCGRWNLTVKTINQFDNPDLYFHRKEGVFIYGMTMPGNAAAAGLRRGDILLQIDGKPVATLDDVRAIYAAAIDGISAKHRVPVSVLRNGLLHQLVLDYLRDYTRE